MLSKLPADRLRKLFTYNPDTGLFVRLVSTSNRVKAGDVAGSVSPDGYMRIWIDGHSYKAHRLAWLFIHGNWPAGQIDHANGNRSDNRIENLRVADQSQQSANSARPRSNKTGVRGVSFHKATQKYTARLACRGRLVHASYHDHIEDAAAAYRSASLKHFGEFSGIHRGD